jgi:hypothetical protein
MALFGFCSDYNYTQDECFRDPVKCVTQYYIFINDRKFRDAYNLRSDRANREMSFERWLINWNNNRSIGFYSNIETASKTADKVVLKYRIGSEDLLPGEKVQYGNYSMKTTLIRQNGKWRIDDFNVTTDDVSKVDKFEFSVPNAKPEKLFEGVPVYPGFKMKDPVLIRDGAEKKAFSVMKASNRQKNVTPDAIAKFYESRMKSQGWESGGPAGGGSCLGILYKKNGKIVLISARRTTWDGTDAPGDPRGATLVIKYRTER